MVSTVVSTVTNWFTPPPPQRQDVVFSVGTDHGVRGGGELVVTLSQPTVTVDRAKTWV